jgi:hypothetical protein
MIQRVFMKNMLIIGLLFTLFAQAMEQEKKWNIIAYGTKINLHKNDNMLDYYADGHKKVDFIVVGQHAQSSKFSYASFQTLIGMCWRVSEVFFETNNRDNNYTIVCRMHRENKIKALFPGRKDYNVCIKIAEPYVCKYGLENYYGSMRGGKSLWDTYEGIEAIKVGLQDVGLCYEKVLMYVAEQNDKKLAKTVALPTLGVEKYTFNALPKDQAAPIAVKTILEYVKNNPKAYDRIELFVEENFEFDLYQELFIQWRGRRNLFWYFTEKDSEDIKLTLLPDLINYIAKLI